MSGQSRLRSGRHYKRCCAYNEAKNASMRTRTCLERRRCGNPLLDLTVVLDRQKAGESEANGVLSE